MFRSLTHTPFFRGVAATVIVAFLGLIPAQSGYAQVVMPMPAPGEMVRTTGHFEPALMAGLRVDMKDPFKFYFIMDKGERLMAPEAEAQEYQKLIKFFLTSLTTANDDMWVNLSPHESNRIIPDKFALTSMGRDLLAQDYLLKQFTASLIYPEDKVGRDFWDKVYAQVYERYGTTEIPLDTFNKVWITADRADIYQKNDTAFLVGSHLKVMLEQDFMAVEQNKEQFGNVQASDIPEANAARKIAADIVREIIVPVIEKEVNEGENFAQVRQVYSAMIMATWFKKTLKESLLGQVYADKNRVAGIQVDDPLAKEKIYQKYVEAYKAGVFNYIKEEVDPLTHEMLPRKYFSGGTNFGPDLKKVMKEVGPEEAAKAINQRPGQMLNKVVVAAFLALTTMTGVFGVPSVANAATPASGQATEQAAEAPAAAVGSQDEVFDQTILEITNMLKESKETVSAEKVETYKKFFEERIAQEESKIRGLESGEVGEEDAAKMISDARNRIAAIRVLLSEIARAANRAVEPDKVVEASAPVTEGAVAGVPEGQEAAPVVPDTVASAPVEPKPVRDVEEVRAKVESLGKEIQATGALGVPSQEKAVVLERTEAVLAEARDNPGVAAPKKRTIRHAERVVKAIKEGAELTVKMPEVVASEKNILQAQQDSLKKADEKVEREQAPMVDQIGDLIVAGVVLVGALAAFGVAISSAFFNKKEKSLVEVKKEKDNIEADVKAAEANLARLAKEGSTLDAELGDNQRQLKEDIKELEAGLAQPVKATPADLGKQIADRKVEVAAHDKKIAGFKKDIEVFSPLRGFRKGLADLVNGIENILRLPEGERQEKLVSVAADVRRMMAVLEGQGKEVRAERIRMIALRRPGMIKPLNDLLNVVSQQQRQLAVVLDALNKPSVDLTAVKNVLQLTRKTSRRNALAMSSVVDQLKSLQRERKVLLQEIADMEQELAAMVAAAQPGPAAAAVEELIAKAEQPAVAQGQGTPAEISVADRNAAEWAVVNGWNSKEKELIDINDHYGKYVEQFKAWPLVKQIAAIKAAIDELENEKNLTDEDEKDRVLRIVRMNDWLAYASAPAKQDEKAVVEVSEDDATTAGLALMKGRYDQENNKLLSPAPQDAEYGKRVVIFNGWPVQKQIAAVKKALDGFINGGVLENSQDEKDRLDLVAIMQKWLEKNENLGGINLSDKHLIMNIKVDGQGMPLPAQLQDPAMRNIEGLSPVIREIAPVTAANMPVLTELLQMSGAPLP